tara:strand:- start:632 stop:832 length:201 start_codon:yes stop_codon:yes gene_type:complete
MKCKNESSILHDIQRKKQEKQEKQDNENLKQLKIQWKEVCKNHFKLLEKENNKERIIKEYNNDINK